MVDTLCTRQVGHLGWSIIFRNSIVNNVLRSYEPQPFSLLMMKEWGCSGAMNRNHSMSFCHFIFGGFSGLYPRAFRGLAFMRIEVMFMRVYYYLSKYRDFSLIDVIISTLYYISGQGGWTRLDGLTSLWEFYISIGRRSQIPPTTVTSPWSAPFHSLRTANQDIKLESLVPRCGVTPLFLSPDAG